MLLPRPSKQWLLVQQVQKMCNAISTFNCFMLSNPLQVLWSRSYYHTTKIYKQFTAILQECWLSHENNKHQKLHYICTTYSSSAWACASQAGILLPLHPASLRHKNFQGHRKIDGLHALGRNNWWIWKFFSWNALFVRFEICVES